MTLSNAHQFIAAHQRLAITSVPKPTMDTIAAMLALTRVLEEQERSVECILPDGLPSHLYALPNVRGIRPILQPERTWCTTFALDKDALRAIEYEQTDVGINVHLVAATPLENPTPSITLHNPPYDGIVVVTENPYDALAGLRNDIDLLHHLPILTIGAPGATESSCFALQFGVSVSETMGTLCMTLGYPLSSETATILRTGIEAAIEKYTTGVPRMTQQRLQWLRRYA